MPIVHFSKFATEILENRDPRTALYKVHAPRSVAMGGSNDSGVTKCNFSDFGCSISS